MVRMDWTMEEFWADGGTTRFIDRLASALGIDAFRIKIVQVYRGSVIVGFSIEKVEVPTSIIVDGVETELTAEQLAAREAAATQELEGLRLAMRSKALTGELQVGAPIMGLETVESDGQKVLLAGEAIPMAPLGPVPAPRPPFLLGHRP